MLINHYIYDDSSLCQHVAHSTDDQLCEMLCSARRKYGAKNILPFLDKRQEFIQISNHFVDNQGQHSHHGRSAIVQFFGAHLRLVLVSLDSPFLLPDTVAVVTWELSCLGSVLHNKSFKNDQSHNGPSYIGFGEIADVERLVEDGQAGWETLHARNANASIGSEVADDTEHGNTAMLDFCLPKPGELVVVLSG